MSGSRPVYQGLVINVSRDSVELPNGHRAELEVVHFTGGAAVVALDDAGRVCLLRQYRYAVGGWIWELPAGKIEPQEPPELTAARELEEEAGRQAARWQSLGRMHSSPGVCDEVIYLYLARDLSVIDTRHEPGELIEVHWVTLAQALQKVQTDEITDAKTITGLYRAQAFVSK